MPNRTEARSAKAALTHATGRLPSLRLFSTLPKIPQWEISLYPIRVALTMLSARSSSNHYTSAVQPDCFSAGYGRA
jgi:hypothetical protein